MRKKKSINRLVRRVLVGRRPRQTLIRALALGVVCYILFGFAFLPFRVDGESMAPSYQDGGFNFANALIYRIRDPQPGDVVLIEITGRRAMHLKRVLAVPGDHIYFVNGILHVNGSERPEPYVAKKGGWTTPPEQLGPGEYFVAGDNRSIPWAGHTMGVVDRSHIVGRILF